MRKPFPKVSNLQNWIGLSENGLRLYEKAGIITPSRNSENGYRTLNISDGDKLFQSRIHTGYGLTIKESANLILQSDFDEQVSHLEEVSDQLEEALIITTYKVEYINKHLRLLQKLKYNLYSVEIVSNVSLYFLPVHDQLQNKAYGESDCAKWLQHTPFVRSAIQMKLEKEPFPTIWFGPVIEEKMAKKLSLPCDNAMCFGKESQHYVTGFIKHGLEETISEQHYIHLLKYAQEQGYHEFGSLLSRHLLLERQDNEFIHYDQIWIPIKKQL